MLFKSTVFILISCLFNLVESQVRIPAKMQSGGSGRNQLQTNGNEKNSLNNKEVFADNEPMGVTTTTVPNANPSTTTVADAAPSTTTTVATTTVASTMTTASTTGSTMTTASTTGSTMTTASTTRVASTPTGSTMITATESKAPSSKGTTIAASRQASIFQWFFAFTMALYLIIM